MNDSAAVAQKHANDEYADEHTGSDGSTMSDHVEKYAKDTEEYAENKATGVPREGYAASEVITDLLIDDGVENRGHRLNLLNPDFNLIGIGGSLNAKKEVVIVTIYGKGEAVNNSSRK